MRFYRWTQFRHVHKQEIEYELNDDTGIPDIRYKKQLT